jgi:putative membrane protein
VKILVRWLINALAFLIVSKLVRDFHVRGIVDALIAAVVFGFVNSTLGLVLKIVTFPFTILTFGLFLVVINAVMLKMAAAVSPGFEVSTWSAAFIGAILLSLITSFLHWIIKDERRVERR